MKNVLIIPPFNPYPLVSGGHQAIFNGIAILEGVANVYLIVPLTESQYKRNEHMAIVEVLPFVHVIPFILPSSRHTLKWYIKVFKNKYCKRWMKEEVKQNAEDETSIISDWIGDTWEEEYELVERVIMQYKIDIVQSEMIPNLPIVKVIPANVKSVFVHHELRFVRNELIAQQAAKVSKEDMLQIAEDKKREIDYLNQYDEIVTLSPIDSAKLKEAGVTKPIVTSMAVVREQKKKIEDIAPKKVLTFIGPEFHAPNYEGVMWFLEKVWGALLKKDSQYSLQIIGKWSEETKQRLEAEYPKVHCLGFVDDIAKAMAGSTMVVPILVGSGIRMKILEAAQLRVPVVSTSVGAEGLPLEDGKNIFIADKAEDFVEAILRLQDAKLRKSFVDSISKKILPQYSLTALKENRKGLYA